MDPRTASPGLAELGHRIGTSERTLSRLFRDEVGMGYTVWRNQLEAEGVIAGYQAVIDPEAAVRGFRVIMSVEITMTDPLAGPSADHPSTGQLLPFTARG